MSTATTMRDAYIAAETAILLGQAWEMGGRKLTLADLAQIQAGRREWEAKVAAETATAAGRAGPALADFSGCA